MTETPPAQPYDWHPMRKTWSFSDYGEWLDEGTTALIEDIETRSEATSDGHVAVSVPASELPIDVIHDHDQHSYGAWFGPAQIGYLSYRLVGVRVALWSTAVLPAYRKRGVATELIAKALDDIRTSGRTVTIICPVVREVIDRYPQYEDLVDKVHPGVRSHAGGE
jgi:predicted GNAT family acetyltransferase